MDTVTDAVSASSHMSDAGSPEHDSRKRKSSNDRTDVESPKRQRQNDNARSYDRPRRVSSPRDRRESIDRLSYDDPAKHRSATQEEKKRGRRLFGGLINTLSQTNTSTQQRRHQEIQRRQQERIQKEKAEDDQKNEEKLSQIRQTRLARQIDFEEKVMQNKHDKLLWKARHLRTKAEPSIYYSPWQLTDAQKSTIDEQVREAKELIAKEKEVFKEKEMRHEQEYGPRESALSRHKDSLPPHSSSPKSARPDEVKTDIVPTGNEGQKDGKVEDVKAITDNPHDEHGDVVVEADEDTVIY